MSILPYTQGYPLDGSTLGQTKSTIRNNLDGTFLTLAVDHIDNNGQPGGNPAGYHTDIHMVTQTPSTTATGTGQFYAAPATAGFGTDAQLWFKSRDTVAGSPGEQITGNNAVTNGFAFFSGVILQWGVYAVVGNFPQTGSFSFTTPFPTSCFSVVLTLVSKVGGTTSTHPIYVRSASLNNVGFTWDTDASTSAVTGFYWFAIGN